MATRQLLVSENVLEKAAVFAVGCCSIGNVTAAAAASALLAPGAALAGVLGAISLRAFIKEDSQQKRALRNVTRRLRRDFVLSGDASEEAIDAVLESIGGRIDADNLFSLEKLREAVAEGSDVVGSLTRLAVTAIAGRDPGFGEAGLARDVANELFSAAFRLAVEECPEFRGQVSLALGQATLSEIRDLSKNVRREQALRAERDNVDTTIEDEWASYHDGLGKACDAPVPGEEIPISQLYVPLRGKFAAKVGDRFLAQVKQTTRKRARASFMDEYGARDHQETFEYGDLALLLCDWLSQRGSIADSLRLLRGGPGSGKSTFARYFSNAVANGEAGAGMRVLYLPLQRIAFDAMELPEVIDRYFVQAGHFQQAPLQAALKLPVSNRFLIVIDGLDEVSRQTPRSAEKTRVFVQGLKKWLATRNARELRYFCLVVGRDASIEEASIELSMPPANILYLVPYRIEAPSRALSTPSQPTLTDQRFLWWMKWRAVKPLVPEGLPDIYDSRDLREISAEPLLLYLLSREEIYRADRRFRSRKQIYDFLLTRVTSDWHHQGTVAEALKDGPVSRLLEIIGAASWADNGRVTSLREIEAWCDHDAAIRSELINLAARRDFGQAVLAFYFNVSLKLDDVGFEFTHKTFGEYLAARFILRRIEACLQMSSMPGITAFWLATFRGAFLSRQIVQFLTDGIDEWPQTRLSAAQKLFCAIRQSLVDQGIDAVHAAATHSIVGAVQTLFFMTWYLERLGCRAEPIQWGEKDDAARLLNLCSELINLRSWHWRHPYTSYVPTERDVFLDWLAGLDFSGQLLHNFRFASADLRASSFDRADCTAACFIDCILVGARFVQANLTGSVWNGSNISNADFSCADLRGADLSLINGYTARQFDSAIIDATTRLPRGMRL